MNENRDIFLTVGELVKNGSLFALVTITKTSGSTPRKAGSRMIVHADGSIQGSVGGAAVEKLAVERAVKCLETGEIDRLELDLNDLEHMQTGMICGGRIELLIEPFGTGPNLFLFGAGHVAQPVAQMAHEVGFHVTVHDEREDWINESRFPHSSLKVGNTTQLATNCNPTEDDFIAVMTYCHDEDYRVLKEIIEKPYYYLGVIGSKRKAAEIRKELNIDGFSQESIDRMTCPIGMDIGSHTPPEIAVSVTAQLVEQKNKWTKEKVHRGEEERKSKQ